MQFVVAFLSERIEGKVNFYQIGTFGEFSAADFETLDVIESS
jgi:hypothetical protein